ncbi:MAG: CBS domain-containing protein [Candidatus Anaerobiospirillum merdipullorum]|uniref:Magnesium and cobalt efflux protein CorC n=1 Tax=Candidatus Anaerobiospirillum merdipullorum TaxID=2838450 RepID=A0A9E2KNI8_9GAMM|nr:CBS domain-containing protein [Candidatus Anaerobiospirillum merdipullorum]
MWDRKDKDKDKDNLLKRMWHGMRPNTRTELAEVIKEAGERDIIDENTEEMIRGVFDVSTQRIGDIMIPRSQMITIDSRSSILDAVRIIAQHGHSRYPVSLEDKDHIIGILNAKDLLPYAAGIEPMPQSLEDILRPCVFVPETKRVDSMLKQFQEKHLHIAVVVDEFGGVCGLVTIEDILELIVGDISDEYDATVTNTPNIVKGAEKDSYLVKGLTKIEDFNAYFQTTLPKVDVDTIAGLVIHVFGHLPTKDESIQVGRFTFKVVTATRHQVQLLQVHVGPAQEEDDE